jgi:hypothetical protein
MARNSGEPVVPAQEFNVGVADAAAEKPDDRVAFRAAGLGKFPDGRAAVFEVNRDHAG